MELGQVLDLRSSIAENMFNKSNFSYSVMLGFLISLGTALPMWNFGIPLYIWAIQAILLSFVAYLMLVSLNS